MKRQLIVCLWAVIIFVCAGAACSNGITDSLPSEAPAVNAVVDGSQPGAAVNVDDLMTNPEDYKGRLYVSGVVSFVSPEQRILGLIDSREFAECGVTTCSSFILPIQWDGPMPQVEDSVEVIGNIQKSDGKFVFVARSLKISGRQMGSENKVE